MMKKVLLGFALLATVSVWADDVWNYNVYDDCSKNGYSVCFENGYECIDLGLPSGTKWASCNIGADKPEDYGNYYAWGEVSPKLNYLWGTYKYANGSCMKLTKYCNNANYGDNGFTDTLTTLEDSDDAATVNWGKNWRMPTAAEIDELCNNCTWTKTTKNNVEGYLVASKTNGNSIFLPAAGYCNSTSIDNIGSQGCYWSSSFDNGSSKPIYASNLHTGYSTPCRTTKDRSEGLPVRPVCMSSSTASTPGSSVILTLYANGCETPNVIKCNAGQQINITAVPERQYSHFVRWTDGNTDNPRLVTVTKNMALTAEFALIISGQCGDNLYWKYADHILTITGSGAMYDYLLESFVPWYFLHDSTDVVVLEKGITHIGINAFNGFAKLNKIELPSTLTSIGESAFAGCRKLYDIYSYAVEPPVAANSSFANYNVYLHVPCDNLRDYQMDAVFGSFKYIQCLGAENTTTDSDVSVTPSNNEATFVWRADGSADTYTLEIRKDGEVFCTLVFNASGQLSSIAFAPARNQVDNGQTRLAAEQTAAGFRFTVTGLSESTHYTFGLTVKDANNATLQTYTGEFNTNTTATAIDNISADTDTTPQKVLINGQVYILRGGKTYTPTGVEVQ